MDDTSIIVLGAGSAERFGGKPKYGLEINGKPLIFRTGQLFAGACLFDQETCSGSLCTCDTLLMSRFRWAERTIILLGDVFYTEVASHTILSSEDTNPVFFTDRQDIFAMSFYEKSWEEIIKAAMKAVISGRNNGRLWELYRRLLGLDESAGLPHEDKLCHLIDDMTQDFDTPEEHRDFVDGKYKNKIHE